jgi:hypothetical protein
MDPPDGRWTSPGAGEDGARGLTAPPRDRSAGSRARLRHRGVAELVPVLARRFLAQLEPGDALPTVRMMADQMHSSLSSIHAAMSRLEEAGAIEFETRGRLGAFLVGRSLGRLWWIAEGGPLVIALPLASSQRYEALATAVKQVLTAADLDVFFIFARGSRQRLQAMHEGRCHLAVMSSFAAGEVRGEGDATVAELLPLSYNTGHRVFYVAGRELGVPLRVVVDRSSADQQLLTAIEFADQEVRLVPAMYSQILRLLETGAADAAVWTVDEMEARRPADILDRALSRTTQERIGDRDTRAAFVGAAVDAPALRAVTAVLDPNRVETIQHDVMSGRIVAEY